MAKSKPALNVILSSTAIRELHDVWLWNAAQYSAAHADRYVGYLKSRINDLARQSAKGNVVRTRPDLHYVLIRRKSKGHGHVVVYSFDDTEVNVLHVFHTAQDWESKLMEQRPNA